MEDLEIQQKDFRILDYKITICKNLPLLDEQIAFPDQIRIDLYTHIYSLKFSN